MKLYLKNLFILILGIFLVSGIFELVSGFSAQAKWQIKDNYVPSEVLQGSINLTLKDVPSFSLFESNLGGEIFIKHFLDNISAVYSCVPVDCESSYIASDAASSKSFSLDAGQEKILGVKITGDLKEEGITDFQFRVSSNAPAACNNPLQVDILDDNDVQYAVNYSIDDFSCYTSKGCFSESEGEVVIHERDYCNKVILVPAPAYRIGAAIKKSGFANISMKLRGVDSGNGSIYLENAECALPQPSSADFEEVSCVLSYPIEKAGEYYVCISTLEGASNYTIQYEQKSPRCGYYDFFEDNYTVDYNLFAKAAKYGSFQGVVFDQESQNSNILPIQDISGYIERRYGGNCEDGCVIPISFASGVVQDISVDNVHLAYSSNIGPRDVREISNVEKEDSLISMDWQQLDLSRAGFRAPSSYGNFVFVLSVVDFPILRANITVKKVPIVSSLFPRNAAQSVKTKFFVLAKSPENKSIARYLWDFGDNTTAESDKNETEHTYSKIGIYTLKVTAIDSSGNEGMGSFQVVVGSSKDAVNQTLRELKSRLNSVNSNLSKLWYRRSIEEKIKLGENEKLLNEAQKAFLSAKNDEDYGKIAQKIEEISLPYWIHEGNTVNIPFVFEIKKINFDHLKELGAGEIGEEEKYENAIWAWFSEKEKYKEYRTVTAYYDKAEVIGTLFKVDVKGDEEMFIVIDRPFEHIQFLEDYKPANLGGASGISFSGEKSFSFFIKGVTNSDELNIYLSPKLENLEIDVVPEPCNYNNKCEKELGETSGNCKADCPPRKLTIFYLILLFIAAFIVYTIVQEWYRKRYESHLFKNKADVYNLINFIGNALKHELGKNEIWEKLKSSGWNSEQISYVFKKIEGKRVGMPGFNIIEIFERRRNKKRFNNMHNFGSRAQGQPPRPGPEGFIRPGSKI